MPESVPIIPEVVEADRLLPRDLLALKRFALLMDEAIAIPGTRKRVGLDAALGLVPGIGDAIGALLSTVIVFGAFRHRVPARKIGRMVVNILIDLVLGSIPIIGDFFDFMFEENVDNLNILLRHRDRQRPPRTTARIIAFVLLILTMFIAVGLVIVAFLLVGVIHFGRTL
ncbi:MAG: DUF4112 domain-containing protein [Acidobacteriota bacterium]